MGNSMAHHAIAPVVLTIGTRPEGIKLLPLYFALKKARIPVFLCSTLQHTELLTEVFDLFGVTPDYSLDIMQPGQDLFYITQSVLQKTKELFTRIKPSLVIVQGDTTSGMAAGMSAFYLKIPVAHVEAGLRTDDLHAPFPEEMNRRTLRVLSQYHFAPTSWATAQLLAEGSDKQSVFCVGNTVVDALRIITDKISADTIPVTHSLKERIQQLKAHGKKIMLFTMHRRESFDGGVHRILTAIYKWLQVHSNFFCFYPYHPNPHIINTLKNSGFMHLDNTLLTEPLTYADLVYVLNNANIVITDSGGIQEEAVSLGKPTIVLREKTERAEAVWAGAAQLVGTSAEKLTAALDTIRKGNQSKIYTTQLFGDGFAAEKIVHILQSSITKEKDTIIPALPITVKKDQAMKTVCVIGLGYIGLPTSIILAQSGFSVMGVDIDHQKVSAINSGSPGIKEPELFEKLQVVLGDTTFCATTHIQAADFFVIAVPTPFKEETKTTHSKKADLSYVFSAIQSVAGVLKKNDTIILESTVPVGTTQKIAAQLEEATGLIAGVDFFVAHCPERVLPGNIFYELVHNARIIGGINKTSVEAAKQLYSAFVTGELYLTDDKSAELVKLVENSSRDTQVAFAHQVASMAASIERDPYEIIELANKHPRVDILKPSSGVGGHCLAVDPWFLVETFGQKAHLLQTAREVNDKRPIEVARHVKHAINEWQQDNKTSQLPVIALLGAAYKPDVDDIRESPTLTIAHLLTQYKPLICDPCIQKEVLKKQFSANQVVKITEALAHADIIIFLVSHTRFKAIDSSCLTSKKVLDFCGIMHVPKVVQGKKEHYFWPGTKDKVYSDTQSNKKEHMIG